MTLDERLQLAYPNGAPAEISAFLRGEWVKNMQGVHLSIKARADESMRHRANLFDRLQALRSAFYKRRGELAELPIERLCDWPANYLIERVNSRNALAWAVVQIEAEMTRVETEYSASLTAGGIENWKLLADLAAVQIKEGI